MKKTKKLLSKRARNPFISRIQESESSPILSQSMPSYSGVDRINMSASTIDTTLGSATNNNNAAKVDKLNAKLTDRNFIKIRDSGEMMSPGPSSSASTSNLQTMMHILKGNIGTGILAMPSAFKNSGLVVGTLGVPFMGVIAIHCMHQLVKCQEFLSANIACDKIRMESPPSRQISAISNDSNSNLHESKSYARANSQSSNSNLHESKSYARANSHSTNSHSSDQTFLDYEDVAEEALKRGPGTLRDWSLFARRAVIVFLLITQIGFCCVYSLFCAESLKTIVENVYVLKEGIVYRDGMTSENDDRIPHIAKGWYMLIILPFMILLNQVKSLKHLAYGSTLANILQMTGLVLIFSDLLQGLPDTSSVPSANGISKLPLFFGTAIYAFEGIGIVLPIKKGMGEPEAFGGSIGVLNVSMIVVASLYTGMGFFGYLKCGDKVMGSITLNLEPSVLNECIRAMFALAIFLSYSLQMYVPVGLIWPRIESIFSLTPDAPRTSIYNFIFRAIFVTTTFLVAISVPKLDLFISLVGAFSSSCLALIFPPLFDTLTFWEERKESGKMERRLWMSKNALICFFGIFGFITGTYAAMSDIVKFFKEGK